MKEVIINGDINFRKSTEYDPIHDGYFDKLSQFEDCNNLEILRFSESSDEFPSEARYGKFLHDNKVYNTYYHFPNLKEVIIEDSDNEFDFGYSFLRFDEYTTIDRDEYYLDSDYSSTPFISNKLNFTNLRYLYVGRPIIMKDHGYTHTIPANITGHIDKLEVGGSELTIDFHQKIDTLILGERMKNIDMSNFFRIENIRVIICKCKTPPTIDLRFAHAPNEFFINTIVIVPYGCKKAYQEAKGWNSFWTITEDEFSSVNSIEADSEDAPAIYYDLSGRQVKNPNKGIYIKRVGSKATKVII